MASTTVAAATLACFLLCALSAPYTEAAIECGKMMENLKTCIQFLRNKVVSPGSACCSTMKELNKGAKTQEDRKAACECVKEATADKNPPFKLDRVNSLNHFCVTKLLTDVFINTSCESVK
ncbi:hypothetical protein H6P81_011998 [Aristolochia fimbriata]|uniref:Bifunctional inhibitor/plant lipid transfer protein/seed storage helical domain-containing protein n=1 Tax=Aristolochia fimbriata TaxID=158543 RepID=A0AAV7ECP4_ARIFI|nr:hypothetical protein H6P81_011998 [Aristolochia fimbriata]